MQDNDEDTLKELAVSEDQVKTLLELETYRQRIYDPIRNEAEVNITDEEAQQSSFSYVSISISGDDLTDDDIATRKEQAQEILFKDLPAVPLWYANNKGVAAKNVKGFTLTWQGVEDYRNMTKE